MFACVEALLLVENGLEEHGGVQHPLHQGIGLAFAHQAHRGFSG